MLYLTQPRSSPQQNPRKRNSSNGRQQRKNNNPQPKQRPMKQQQYKQIHKYQPIKPIKKPYQKNDINQLRKYHPVADPYSDSFYVSWYPPAYCYHRPLVYGVNIKGMHRLEPVGNSPIDIWLSDFDLKEYFGGKTDFP